MNLPNLPELPAPNQAEHKETRRQARVLYARRYEQFPHPNTRFAVTEGLVAILADFFGYCEAARNACRTGAWTLDQVRLAVDKALSQYDQSHQAVILQDPRWRQHLEECKALPEVAPQRIAAVAETTQSAQPQDCTRGPRPTGESFPRAGILVTTGASGGVLAAVGRARMDYCRAEQHRRACGGTVAPRRAARGGVHDHERE